jgi:type IV pilus biogenesis protein CpaD/CtpE
MISMSMRVNKIFVGRIFYMALALFLPACDMYEEGHLTPHRLQVHEEKFVFDAAVAELDQSYIAALGRDYESRGGGPIELTVTYDPHSRRNSAMRAGETAARLANAFRAEGMKDIRTNILPVLDQGEMARAFVTFAAYTAAPPPGCSVMPGLEDMKVDHDPEYKIGCTVETQLSRQIARPRDLAGQAQNGPETDGRRAGNIVDVYRTGIPNQPLKGETASE